MLTKYRYDNTDSGFAVCAEGEKAEWINLEDPSREELAEVVNMLGVPLLFLTDPLDPKERPRLDQEDNCD
ncbi:MAG: magnesium transporter CorA family protein, partial [Deltaproteobacteria bacterium]|nr:magnesium transporter CorA family protein [Deltaproteobacteria bacterium]